MKMCCSVAYSYCIVLYTITIFCIFLSVQLQRNENVLQCCIYVVTVLYYIQLLYFVYFSLCIMKMCCSAAYSYLYFVYISLYSCSVMKMCCSVAYSYCIVLYTITIFCIFLSVQLQRNENVLQCCI